MSLPERKVDTNTSAVVSIENAAQEFEDFIYLVSHDVRNSVRALLELPQWIEEDIRDAGLPISKSLAGNIELMNTHTRRLDRMLIDLLVYSRIGRMQESIQLHWNTVIDTTLDQVPVPQGFELNREIHSPTIFLGEHDALTLVSSLLSNSIKHHDSETGFIKISTHDTPQGPVLSVWDDGPGIRKKSREKVFEVMTTLKPRDEIEGSGMGLANVRKIANLYKAQIEWVPTEGMRGTRIAIRFPNSCRTVG